MPKYRRVYITEKTTTLEHLRKYVGPRDIVLAAQGHLLDTKGPKDINPEWDWAPLRQKPSLLPMIVDDIPLVIGTDRSGKSHRGRLMDIVNAINDSEAVVVACDAGREGSLIGWDIVRFAKWKGPVSRLYMLKLTPEAIAAEIRLLDDKAEWDRRKVRDYATYLEGRARRHDDWHSGMNGVVATSLKLKPAGWSQVFPYGGVQMPTLALLADHEMKIRNFVPEDFFKVHMPVKSANGHDVELVWRGKPPLKDRAIADALAQTAKAWAGKLAVDQRDVRRAPPRLFSLNTLQKACAAQFGWRPDYTEKMAQELYDKGYASYPRTEATYLPAEEARDATQVIAAISRSGTGLAAHAIRSAHDAPVIRKGHSYKEEPSEHYAYVPTTTPMNAGSVSADAGRLYELISQHFVAAHMPDAVDAVTTIQADVNYSGKMLPFRKTGSIERSAGWRAAFGGVAEPEDNSRPGAQKDEEDTSSRLPPIADGEVGRATDARVVVGRTEPPERITVGELPELMARLIDFVEDKYKPFLENPVNPDNPKGLGTAASRKDIVPKLFNRKVVIEQKGGKRRAKDPKIEVTDIGIALVMELRRCYKQDAYPVARALFEAELKNIGDAPTVEAAERLEADFRRKTAEKCHAMIKGIFGEGQPLSVSSETIVALGGKAFSGGANLSDKMVKAVKATQARTGDAPPDGWEANFDLAKAYLNKHPYVPGQGGSSAGGGADGSDWKETKRSGVIAKVPYESKDQAKKMGAVWDGDNKAWRLPNRVDVLEEAARLGWIQSDVVKRMEPAL